MLGMDFSVDNIASCRFMLGMLFLIVPFFFWQLTLLQRYEKERKAANVAMAAVLDGFQKMYSVDLGPLNVVRAAAFHGAQYISPLKKNIISYATGDTKWPLFQ